MAELGKATLPGSLGSNSEQMSLCPAPRVFPGLNWAGRMGNWAIGPHPGLSFTEAPVPKALPGHGAGSGRLELRAAENWEIQQNGVRRRPREGTHPHPTAPQASGTRTSLSRRASRARGLSLPPSLTPLGLWGRAPISSSGSS